MSEWLGDWAGITAGWLYWYFLGGGGRRSKRLPAPLWLRVDFHPGMASSFDPDACADRHHLFSTRPLWRVRVWFASIKGAAIVAFVAIAASYSLGLTSPAMHRSPTTGNGGFGPWASRRFLPASPASYFLWWGRRSLTVVAAESRAPARAIAKLTLH